MSCLKVMKTEFRSPGRQRRKAVTITVSMSYEFFPVMRTKVLKMYFHTEA